MSSSDSGAVRSIVLIDDDADFLHVLKKRLEAQRAEFATTTAIDIHTYSDAVEALVNIPTEPICIVMIDYNMPGCTGLDWIPKLKNANVGPVILLTNQNDANVTAAAFRAGVSDYLPKSDVVAGDLRLGRSLREAVHRYRLEVRNATLTRELKVVNAELEARNKHLHELSETAHQFVDDVAHDLRTPLTVIEQYASIIAEGLSGAVTDQQWDQLGIIATATHEMADMVDDFLDSSKLKARSLTVDREPHTVQELLDSVSPMLTVRAQSKGISIQQEISADAGKFFGDLSKTGRILINLAVNAIKVTPAGRPLKLWARPTDAGDVQIGVTDEGPGMRSEDLKVIFERFKQLDEPALSGTKGFGLGLSIVKQLVWLNLGTIEVQSELGKGSTFSFKLPGCHLSRILSCYIESINTLDSKSDLYTLQIRAASNPDVSILRRMVSSCCYPMDLILENAEENCVNVVGVSDDPAAWTDRIREAIARFQSSIGQKSLELDFKVNGPLVRDGDKAQLGTALTEALHAGSCYA